jgi:hypothetical protein
MKLFDLISSLGFLTILVVAIFASVFLKAHNVSSTTEGLEVTLKNFWLLLPDYTVNVMLKLFSFSFILSLILIFIVVWSSINLMKTRQDMHDQLDNDNDSSEESNFNESIVIKNDKWQKVVKNMNSISPNDWKLAILECDIILSEILEKMGYLQESISEKLKAIEPSDFTNIESAWEAHKIRNMIAHEGSDFMINEREAKRVVGLYEAVFREFEYI